MNDELLALITATSERTSIDPKHITLMFAFEEGVPTWTATLLVFTDKKNDHPRPFSGLHVEPSQALADAEEAYREWKDPSIRAKRAQQETLAEIAANDPELSAKLRARGIIP
jgi:hypothetical protein